MEIRQDQEQPMMQKAKHAKTRGQKHAAKRKCNKNASAKAKIRRIKEQSKGEYQQANVLLAGLIKKSQETSRNHEIKGKEVVQRI